MFYWHIKDNLEMMIYLRKCDNCKMQRLGKCWHLHILVSPSFYLCGVYSNSDIKVSHSTFRAILKRNIQQGKSMSKLLKNLTGKTVFFTQSSSRSLVAFDLFYMFRKSIKFYAFHCHIFRSTDVFKQTENERLPLSATFTAKFELIFVLIQKNAFLKQFYLKANK